MATTANAADLEAELARLQRELEKKKLEEQILALEQQLVTTTTTQEETPVEEEEEEEEEIIEEYYEEEIIEEEIIEEDDEEVPVVEDHHHHHHHQQQQQQVDVLPEVESTNPAAAPTSNVAIGAKPPSPKKNRGGVGRWFGRGNKNKTDSAATPSKSTADAAAAAATTTPVKKAAAAFQTPGEPLPPQPFTPRVISRDIPPSPAGEETPWETLLGPQLYAGGKLIKRSTNACVHEQDYLLLFFGSSWNRESKAFFPALKDFYCTISKQHKLEAVYISHDRSLQDFKQIFSKSPWPAMTTGTSHLKNALAQHVKAIEVPTVAVLDVATTHVITTYAVQDIAALQRNNVEEANALVETWKAITPIPFDQVMMDSRLKHGKLERGTLYWQD